MTIDQIRTKVREITNTTTNDYSDASLIRDLNQEMALIQIKVLTDRGVLEFDDSNYSDLPVATFTITAGTAWYKIIDDENSNKVLTKHKVAILHNGSYTDIPRLQVKEGNQDSLTSDDTAIVPSGYYEIGESIVFAETPSSSTTGKVWFDRDMDFFATGDTTKEPGIPTPYHNLIAYRTAYNYALDNNLPNLDRIMQRVNQEEERMSLFEETRRGDESTRVEVETYSGI